MVLENDLGRDDIKKLVLRLALPAMVAQFVNILYSIVDRIYVANIPVIGEPALAALGVCAPLGMLMGSFSLLVGIGGATLMSISLGEKDRKGARTILSNAILMLAVLSVLITVGVFIFKNQLLTTFGASGNLFAHANDYFTIYIFGTIFAIVGTGLNQFVMSQGYAKVAMKSVILGAVTNIILDPIFIFPLGWGVKGAAAATVVAQMVSALYTIKFLMRKDIPAGINFGNYSGRTMLQIVKMGVNPFIIMAMDNVVLIVMNMTLRKHGGELRGDMLLACSTILQSFMSIITMPLLGITTGTQPILGYNYGAKNSKRVMETEKYTFLLAVTFTTVMFLVARVLPQFFVRIFTTNPQYIDTAIQAIRMFTWALIPMAIQYTVVDGFTGIGAVRVAIVLSLFRKGTFLLSVVWIPLWFDVMNIFYAEPISIFLGSALSAIIFFSTIKKILENREMSPL